MLDRFRSKGLELPDPKHGFDRVDLILYDVDHSAGSFEARIFLGAPRDLARDAGVEHPAYAGSFFVFGHGRCHGEEGHCDLPEGRAPFDLRLPHHLEPETEIVTVTAAIERLLDAKKRRASVDVIAHGPGGEPVEALDFTDLRLLTYR